MKITEAGYWLASAETVVCNDRRVSSCTLEVLAGSVEESPRIQTWVVLYPYSHRQA